MLSATNWDSPYKLTMELLAKLKGFPQSYFEERLANELAHENACENALYPEAVFIQDRCVLSQQERSSKWEIDLPWILFEVAPTWSHRSSTHWILSVVAPTWSHRSSTHWPTWMMDPARILVTERIRRASIDLSICRSVPNSCGASQRLVDATHMGMKPG